MKIITNILAFITGLYGVIACSIAFVVIRLLAIPLLPFVYTNDFKLKENDKWRVVDKLFDICDKISERL